MVFLACRLWQWVNAARELYCRCMAVRHYASVPLVALKAFQLQLRCLQLHLSPVGMQAAAAAAANHILRKALPGKGHGASAQHTSQDGVTSLEGLVHELCKWRDLTARQEDEGAASAVASHTKQESCVDDQLAVLVALSGMCYHDGDAVQHMQCYWV